MNSIIGDYDKIMSDHDLFNKVVYTPLSEALKLLEERRKDPVLMAKIEELLKGDIPEILKNKKCGVMGRQVATPNFDTQAFIKHTKENQLKTILFEYHEDKFTSKNCFKHSLGKILVSSGFSKNGNDIVEKINIVDHVKYDGKKINEVLTLWKEPLVDFHKSLFKRYKLPDDIVFYDVSQWYNRNGKIASVYYVNYLMLFVAHGILFENFLLSKNSEGDFTKNIVLPAINKIISLTGLKPLVVPIPPMDIEDEEFWISHPNQIKNFIPKN